MALVEITVPPAPDYNPYPLDRGVNVVVLASWIQLLDRSIHRHNLPSLGMDGKFWSRPARRG